MPLNHISKYSQLTEEQFQRIGKVVVEWANIEMLCKQLLGRILFTPSFPTRIFTDQYSASTTERTILEALTIHEERYEGRIVSPSQIQEIKSVIERVARVRGSRNRFAHFCWCRNSDEEIFGTNFSGSLPDSKKARKGSMTITNEGLDELYENSHELVECLSTTLNALPEISEQSTLEIAQG